MRNKPFVKGAVSWRGWMLPFNGTINLGNFLLSGRLLDKVFKCSRASVGIIKEGVNLVICRNDSRQPHWRILRGGQ